MSPLPDNDTDSQPQSILRHWPYVLGTGMVFIVAVLIGIQAWEIGNSVWFCTEVCHNVHPEEPGAYADSYHAQVKCVECHMGRVGTLQSMMLKASHFRHIPEVLFHNYERPLESATLRPANESCERCHWPAAFHGDRVREIAHYQLDEQNTKELTYLILKTGGGERDKGLGYGIHWHIENPVEYIATDGAHAQDIRWVRTTLPDGRTVEYSDVMNPLSPQEIASAETRQMDCVSCHNRVGHPFQPPNVLIDKALAEGVLDPSLPFIKKEMDAALNVDQYESLDQALDSVGRFKTDYDTKYPAVATNSGAAIEQAVSVAETLLPRLVFEDPGVTWESFPDDAGHKYFPGCFRCHDGKHLSPEGESIRLHCNICHSVPEVVAAGSRPPQMPVATVQEPPSHLETNFIADHRFQADQSCTVCHGEVVFGTDNSNFCSNSGCHGQAWPEVDLNAAFPHPIELTGKHADVWCHSCHNGVKKPEYVCSNCHQPPAEPHFGSNCEACHTTEGFAQVNLSDFQHPEAQKILVGVHATTECSSCHVPGTQPAFKCANCHEPPSEPHYGEFCDMCHTPETFAGVKLSAHPFSLQGKHAELQCSGCHSEPSFDTIAGYTCANCHTPPHGFGGDDCALCHQSGTTWSQLQGMEDFTHPDPAWQNMMKQHSKVACQGCHFQGYEDLSTKCDACHAPKGGS